MTFEETEKFIKSNLDKFDEMIPTMTRPAQVLLDIIDIFHCMEDNPDCKTKLPGEKVDSVDSICRMLVDAVLTAGVSETETQLISCAIDVFYNYSEIDGRMKSRNLDTLLLLTKAKRTMDDTINLLSRLYDKFRMFEACNLEEETATLSRKYYSELKAFMERKGDHDASYSTDRAKKESDLRIAGE